MSGFTALAIALLASGPSTSDPKPASANVQRREDSSRSQALSFNELFAPSPGELKPSQKLLELNGKRVKIVGFMAKMEMAPSGAFYLVPRPVVCDEAGGGTADLPPEVVRVIVRSAQGRKIEFIPRALEVTGVLEIGNRLEEDGQVSAVRLILDQSKDRRIRTKATQTRIKSKDNQKSPTAKKADTAV